MNDCVSARVALKAGGRVNGVLVRETTLRAETLEYPILTEAVITDYPIGNGGDYLEVELSGGSNLSCGQVVMGARVAIGEAQVGDSGFEGLDFSHVEANIYGDIITVERPSTLIHRFDILIKTEELGKFANQMKQFRGGKRALWIGDDAAGVRAWAYGYARDWQVYYSDGRFARIRLVIQGVV